MRKSLAPSPKLHCMSNLFDSVSRRINIVSPTQNFLRRASGHNSSSVRLSILQLPTSNVLSAMKLFPKAVESNDEELIASNGEESAENALTRKNQCPRTTPTTGTAATETAVMATAVTRTTVTESAVTGSAVPGSTGTSTGCRNPPAPQPLPWHPSSETASAYLVTNYMRCRTNLCPASSGVLIGPTISITTRLKGVPIRAT
ncbi:hypothetical protein PoB_002501200 [Plakobranchus ocellatus]|uniref:Uncharacterized protein n=1 Tax=Plakobranchus ocellatus TaxID=259542 RepID=A0AAV3ZTQ4_9GAST|nr:hypothetical protein PoB_002501200 [Plakobranchus ocellatus]